MASLPTAEVSEDEQRLAEMEAAERARAAEARSLGKLLRDELLPAWRNERTRLDRIDGWARWTPENKLKLPRGATPELRALRDLAMTPWLGLVVTSTSQCMYVDGWHSDEDEGLEPVAGSDGEPTRVVQAARDSRPWRIWRSNDMHRKQVALHRATLTYGYAYATVLPGEDFQGDRVAVIKGKSPRKMMAFYDDPAGDEWPQLALEVLSENETAMRLRLFDDQQVRTIRFRLSGIDVEADPAVVVERREEHGCGVTPVVRYTNQLDLDGRTPGEIEPHIPIAAKINKTAYDRLLVQHFNSWKIRTVTGMTPPDTREEENRKRLQLRQDDILIADDPDTRFGTLDETGLAGFIAAHEADVESLAAVTQTPTHELTGKLINVSAEGLAMIRASQQAKVHERQVAMGSAHSQALRLGCFIEGDKAAAADFTGRVTWQDTSIRSMAQAVDALGKAHQMLQIPAQGLWGKLPGTDRSEVEEWVRMAAALDPIERMRAELDRQAAAPDAPADPAADTPPAPTPARKPPARGRRPAR